MNDRNELLKKLCEAYDEKEKFFSEMMTEGLGIPTDAKHINVNDGLNDPIKKKTTAFNTSSIKKSIEDRILGGSKGEAMNSVDPSGGPTKSKSIPGDPGEGKDSDAPGKPEHNGEAKDSDLVNNSELKELFDTDDERSMLARLVENLEKIEASYEDDNLEDEFSDFFTECGCNSDLNEPDYSDEDDEEDDDIEDETEADLELEFGDPDDDEIEYDDEDEDIDYEDYDDEDFDEDDEMEY